MARQRILPLFALIPALALFAVCNDVTAPVDTEKSAPEPFLAISDGAHDGNAHFYFLPPMVPASDPSGTFDGSFFPEIVICLLLSDGTACDSSQPPDFPINFTTATGPGAETLRIVPEDEHYIVNWHTDESGVVPGLTYRISVLVAGTMLGFADVEFGTTSNEVKNLSTGGIIGLKDGRTLPIKFRIEEGAVFVISTTDGAVVLAVPAGALPEGTEVGITVEPSSISSADQSDIGLIDGTVFNFGPDGTAFSSPATLTLAYDPAKLPTDLPESSLKILTEEAGEWLEILGSTVDEDANTVTGLIDGFSGKGVGGAVATVDVTPSSETVDPAETVQLLATSKDAAGAVVNRKVTWTSLDPGVATVDNNGLVTGVDVGTVTIEATSGSATGTAVITVNFVLASISTGDVQACGVTAAGAAYCWGANLFGALGDGTNNLISIVPVAVFGGLSFQSVNSGQLHHCGVTDTEAAYCWGRGLEGQLGNNSGMNSNVPVPVSGMLTFRSVSAGPTHSCGVTDTGAAYCWGGNFAGELGDGTTTASFVPVVVSNPASGPVSWASVSAGGNHSCGVTTTGEALCWGVNFLGQLGDGTTTNSSVPVAVLTTLTFQSVSAGDNHSCGVTDTGAAYCWGGNFAGELGDGTTTASFVPVVVSDPASGPVTWASVSAGGNHSCGVTTTGEAFCWGLNNFGQLGDGTTTIRNVPVALSSMLTFQSVSPGNTHSCGVTVEERGYCWGLNNNGQLGNGTVTNSSVPVAVSAPF